MHTYPHTQTYDGWMTGKPRRGAVKTSGFESDDENVEEKHGEEDTEEEDSGDEVEEAPGRLLSRSVPSLGESDACDTDKNAEEEEDMFGDSFTAPDKKAKKNKTLTAIEGQEWNPEARDYTDDGTKIEPFNMDQELEEGHFDAEGMYIRKSDQLAMHDKWLQGLTATEIEKVLYLLCTFVAVEFHSTSY